jgi:hypothetical protein
MGIWSQRAVERTSIIKVAFHAQVYNKFGSVKVTATSRQIGSIEEGDIMSCSRGAIAHSIDVVSSCLDWL